MFHQIWVFPNLFKSEMLSPQFFVMAGILPNLYEFVVISANWLIKVELL